MHRDVDSFIEELAAGLRLSVPRFIELHFATMLHERTSSKPSGEPVTTRKRLNRDAGFSKMKQPAPTSIKLVQAASPAVLSESCSDLILSDLPTQIRSDPDPDLTPAIPPVAAPAPLVLLPDEPAVPTFQVLLAILERASAGRFVMGTVQHVAPGVAMGGNRQRKAFPLASDWQLVGEWLAAHEFGKGPLWKGSPLTPAWAASQGFKDAHLQATAWGKRGRGPVGAASAPPTPRAAFSARAIECFGACAVASGGKFFPPAERTCDAHTRAMLEGLAQDFDPPDWRALGALFAAEAGTKFMQDAATSPSLLARKGPDLMARAIGAAEARRNRAPSHFSRRAHEEDARRPDPIDTNQDDIPDFG